MTFMIEFWQGFRRTHFWSTYFSGFWDDSRIVFGNSQQPLRYSRFINKTKRKKKTPIRTILYPCWGIHHLRCRRHHRRRRRYMPKRSLGQHARDASTRNIFYSLENVSRTHRKIYCRSDWEIHLPIMSVGDLEVFDEKVLLTTKARHK